MTDFFLPPHITPSGASWRLLSNTAAFHSPLSGTTRTLARSGDRWACTLSFDILNRSESSALLGLLSALRGQANRVYVPDYGYVRRGSLASSELFSNNVFASGTTGWQASGTYTALAVADRVMRSTRFRVSGANSFALGPSSAVNVTQYAPYAARYHLKAGLGAFPTGFILYDNVNSESWGAASTAFGLLSAATVARSATLQPNLLDQTVSSMAPGAFVDIAYTSFARCALVDNAPNLLQYSDQFNVAPWSNGRITVAANSTAAPDGTTTADSLVEDTSVANTHYISQSATVSSSAAEYALSVSLKAGTRTWARVSLVELTGGTDASAYVNLSTGALGSQAGGANLTNMRSFVSSEGNGWYRVTIVARKTNAATQLSARIGLATGDNGQTYTGDGASLIYAWRASLAASSVPVLGAQTTTTASSGTSQTGPALYLKGLPASSNGLLLPGDIFEVNGELKRVTSSLDSDAAGLGYVQFSPPLRSSPANDAPVILTNPLCRMLLAENSVGMSQMPGGFTRYSFDLIEDLL